MNTFIKIEFWNTCDLSPLYYQNDFKQRIYLDSDMVRASYPVTEAGAVRSSGEFVQEFIRWEKKYMLELYVPEYVLDALFWMSAHDTIQLYDKDGDIITVENPAIEYEWDGCHADVKLSFTVDELVKGRCCDQAGELDPSGNRACAAPVTSFLSTYTNGFDLFTPYEGGEWYYQNTVGPPAAGYFSNFINGGTWNDNIMLYVRYIDALGNNYTSLLKTTQDVYIIIRQKNNPQNYVVYHNTVAYTDLGTSIRYNAIAAPVILYQGGIPIYAELYEIFITPNLSGYFNVLVEGQKYLYYTEYEWTGYYQTWKFKGDIYLYQNGVLINQNLATEGTIVEDASGNWYEYDGIWWRIVPIITLAENPSGYDWIIHGLGVRYSFIQVQVSEDGINYTDLGLPVNNNIFKDTGVYVTLPTVDSIYLRVHCYNHSCDYGYSQSIYTAI